MRAEHRRGHTHIVAQGGRDLLAHGGLRRLVSKAPESQRAADLSNDVHATRNAVAVAVVGVRELGDGFDANSAKLNANKSALEEKYETNIKKHTGWIDGTFILEDVPFSEVITALERQFDIKITCDVELSSKRGNYSFKNQDLETAIKEAIFPLNAKHETNGKNVIITTE